MTHSETPRPAPVQDLPELLVPETVLFRAAEQLSGRFDGVFNEETVERCVFESYTALRRTARVTAHLPSLAVHFATDRLTALAQARGQVDKPVPEVLFVCEQNAGRSQMAAALLDHRAQGRVHVRSAGSMPADQLNPALLEAMSEVGLDLSTSFPKPLTDDVVAAADVVVSMGCGDACPIYPGKRYLDWELEDPAGKGVESVRPIRDDIKRRILDLLESLDVTPVAI